MKKYRKRDYVIVFIAIFVFRIIQLFDPDFYEIIITFVYAFIMTMVIGTLTNKFIHSKKN